MGGVRGDHMALALSVFRSFVNDLPSRESNRGVLVWDRGK